MSLQERQRLLPGPDTKDYSSINSDAESGNISVQSPAVINKRKISLGGWLLYYLPILRSHRRISFQGLALILTFISYTCYHMNRRSLSAVKSVLAEPNCSSPSGNLSSCEDHSETISSNFSPWAPFDGSQCGTILGSLDNSWGISYAIAMFFSGIIAERMDLRYFLTFGMIGSAIGSALFGLAFYIQMHHLYYFILVQAFSGIMQSTGWPAVVPIMGNWFGIKRRGLFMGIWNSHTSVGNILGLYIPSIWARQYTWAWSFFVPALIMFGAAIIIFMFLVVDPTHIGLSSPVHQIEESPPSTTPASPIEKSSEVTVGDNGNIKPLTSSTEEDGVMVTNVEKVKDTLPTQRKTSITSVTSTVLKKINPARIIIGSRNDDAIGIVGALKIPGVIEYSLALFFSKLVAYTFLFWLPYYIANTCIGGTKLSSSNSDIVAIVFEVGGIIGSILTGLMSDVINARATTCVIMLYLSVPFLFFYRHFGDYTLSINIVLMLICGLFVNGPYACITTAVSSDLGTHKSLKGNQKAKATVSAVIDGTGSIGAALGPFVVGWISEKSWNDVFYLLMASCFLSSVFLTRLVITEIRKFHLKYKKR